MLAKVSAVELLAALASTGNRTAAAKMARASRRNFMAKLLRMYRRG
jgi:hypothetical protein